MSNLDQLLLVPSRSGEREERDFTGTFEGDEVDDGGFDGVGDDEEAVVLEEGGFFGAELGGDGEAFLFVEDYALVVCVEDVVSVENTVILSEHV